VWQWSPSLWEAQLLSLRLSEPQTAPDSSSALSLPELRTSTQLKLSVPVCVQWNRSLWEAQLLSLSLSEPQPVPHSSSLSRSVCPQVEAEVDPRSLHCKPWMCRSREGMWSAAGGGAEERGRREKEGGAERGRGGHARGATRGASWALCSLACAPRGRGAVRCLCIRPPCVLACTVLAALWLWTDSGKRSPGRAPSCHGTPWLTWHVRLEGGSRGRKGRLASSPARHPSHKHRGRGRGRRRAGAQAQGRTEGGWPWKGRE